jgi:hypothetical protein
MDETRLALMRPPAHKMLWNEGQFLFRLTTFSSALSDGAK